MILNWDLGAKFDDQLFTFVPPANAHQIGFDTDRKAGAK
jgi:outer membrane lipoprotein-sorting protein